MRDSHDQKRRHEFIVIEVENLAASRRDYWCPPSLHL